METDPPPRRAAGWRAAALAALALAFAAGWFEVHNLDIWLHARTGQWIVEHGTVPRTNVMSEIHHDYPSVHDKWGFQVVSHWLFDGLGPDAVVIARVLVLAALFLVLLATARGLGADPWAALLLLVLAAVAMRSRFTFRPDLLSLLFQALVIHALLVGRPGPRRVALLVALQVLWVNVHGYFLLGWVTVGAAAAGELVRGRAGRGPGLRLLALGTLLCAACLLNPAGVLGWWHPFAILADLSAHQDLYRESILEFRPTFAADPRLPWDRQAYFVLGGLTLGLLGWELGVRVLRRVRDGGGRGSGVAVGGGVGSAVGNGSAIGSAGAGVGPGRVRGATDPEAETEPEPEAEAEAEAETETETETGRATSRSARDPLGDRLFPALVVVLLYAVMSVSLRRSMAPFAVAAVPVAAALWTRRLGARVPGPWPPLLLLAVVAFAELGDRLSVHDGLDQRSGLGLSTLAYPDTGIRFIAEHLPHASVFTAFSYGSTFTGRRWPEQVASINGNTHGYPTSYFADVVAAVSGSDAPRFERLVRRDGHTVALLQQVSPLAGRLLRANDWTLVCLGVHEAVFVRAGSVPDDWLAAHDLERVLAEGGLPPVPATEPPPPVLSVQRAFRPTAELSAAVLLMGGGYGPQALALARRALALLPDDPEALALTGLLELRLGSREPARELLRRSLEVGGYNPWEDDVRAALAAD